MNSKAIFLKDLNKRNTKNLSVVLLWEKRAGENCIINLKELTFGNNQKCPTSMNYFRDCSEFLVRGGGVVLLLGRYPFLTRFPRGGMNILQRHGGGASIFYIYKKNTEHGKMSLLHDSPCRFCTIHPCCPEKLPAPWVEGGTHF